jgi:hypothetical protein
MRLGWNEITQRAVRFSREWSDETREGAEAKSFWDAFFDVFGIPRRSVATFEEPVRKLGGQYGFIDLFWKGRLLVEHKSRGKSLDQAESQAFAYLQALAGEGRHDEMPRHVIVTDFDRLALYDLEPGDDDGLAPFCGFRVRRVEIRVRELHRHVRLFGFIPGYTVRAFAHEDPINIRAAAVMGLLHDALAAGGYSGHALERFLVRVLFCLFSDDTGIFEPNVFSEYLENQTKPDGSDLGLHLARLFQTLNTPPASRQAGLDERLLNLPYVNGGLFAETLPLAQMDAAMRAALLRCTAFDWSRISPAVFGSLFQTVMDPAVRRQIGAHYTSERDILKVVSALFLDDLRAEFAAVRRDRRKLDVFHRKLGTLKFFDPACGCGNFLVIAYRELRLLELEVLDALGLGGQAVTDISLLSRVDVDQFFGVEIAEWPARIAETALWLMDHQMNLLLAEKFGQYFVRLPLKKSARIVCDNALRLNWHHVLSPVECSFILGNPPFVGKKEQNADQKADMAAIWGGAKGAGILDYVTCWYVKAAEFIRDTPIRVGFVSTNSITQGEQPGVLWSALFARGMQIIFAHRTFPWQSEARGPAHVHVVIIGLAQTFAGIKRIYEPQKGSVVSTDVKNINPYLVEGPNTVLRTSVRPLNGAPPIRYGSMMIDKDRRAGEDAGLVLTSAHREALLRESPALDPFILRLYGGDEFLNGTERWCLWLVDAPAALLRSSGLLAARLESVRAFRLGSRRPQTRALAATPSLFGEIRQPKTSYLLIPKVSSEKRTYIPIGFLSAQDIASGSALVIPDATRYHFGILSSAMHNAWMRGVAGRLESRYQYSNNIVYNNFPWPQWDAPAPSRATSDGEAASVGEAAARTYWSSYHESWDDDEAPPAQPETKPARLAGGAKKRADVEAAAQAVLDARAGHPDSTLADLYDPLFMPPDLAKAHAALDRAVDRCYRTAPFQNDRQRVEFLLVRYEALSAPLLPPMPMGRKRR